MSILITKQYLFDNYKNVLNVIITIQLCYIMYGNFTVILHLFNSFFTVIILLYKHLIILIIILIKRMNSSHMIKHLHQKMY